MALKDERTNKYAGAIGVVSPSTARIDSKRQEANLFESLADSVAKNAYSSAVQTGKIKASLAADTYQFTTENRKFTINNPNGTQTEYEREVPIPYEFPPELSQYSDTATFDAFQEKVAKRYISELETVSSDIILKEESRAIMDGAEQMIFEQGVRGALGDFYESIPPNVANVLKLSDERLIIQRGRIVQNNYNEIQLTELNTYSTNAQSKAYNYTHELLTNGQSTKEAIDFYIDKQNNSSGSESFNKKKIEETTKTIQDMEKLYKILEPHIVPHANDDTDKLADSTLIANVFLNKSGKSVTLSNNKKLDITLLNDIDNKAINQIKNRLTTVNGANEQYQKVIQNKAFINKAIETNTIERFGTSSGQSPKDVAKMLFTTPGLLKDVYQQYLTDIPQDEDHVAQNDNPLADNGFRTLLFNQGLVPENLRNDISTAINSEDPELIYRNIMFIKELKGSGVQLSKMGFTESDEDKIHVLGMAQPSGPDGTVQSTEILRYINNIKTAKELVSREKLTERYLADVKEKYGSLDKFDRKISERLDVVVANQTEQVRNTLDDVYYGSVVTGRVRRAVIRRINNAGAELDDDMLDDVINTEVNKMLGSGEYAFSTRGVRFRKEGNVEDSFTLGDVLNPLQAIPDMLYNADAIDRQGVFMYDAPEAHHGINDSVEYLVPFAEQIVKNHFDELQKEYPNSNIIRPENIADNIRFESIRTGRGVDFVIVLVSPDGSEQMLSTPSAGLLKMDHEQIQDIKDRM